MTPTVGRIVHYNAAMHEQREAAIITYVWGPDLVNLMVFSHNGTAIDKPSIRLVPMGAPCPEGSCEWPVEVFAVTKQYKKKVITGDA